MTSFAITHYGQCCRRHVVGQRIVSDISIVHSYRSISSMCCESNYANLLLRLLTAVLGTSCFTYQTHLDLQHGGIYMVTIDRDVTSLHPIYKPLNISLLSL